MKAIVVRRLSALPDWLGLILLYAACVALRAVLATSLSIIPVVNPDEPLYFNLARSLWTAGEVSVRGQPITYDSLLYPLVLSPLFALPAGVNMLNAIQVLNAVLMNMAIFPAWALARRLTGRRGAAWCVVVLAALLPDLALTRMVLTENIGYPLLLLTLWLALRAFDSRRARDALLAALGGALLYLLKPGYIAVALAICVIFAVTAIRHRDRRSLWQLLTMIACLAAVFVIWRLITQHALGVDHTFRSVYASQTPPLTLGNLQHVFNGSLLYLYFLPVACLVFVPLVPLAHARSLKGPDRSFLWTVYLAILLTILGTCFFIYIDEFMGEPFASRVHLRYVAGFMPVLFALSFSPALEGRRLNGALFAMLAYMLAGTVAFGMDAITSVGSQHTIDALSLAYLIKDDPGTDTKTLYTLALVFGVLAGGYWLATRGWTRRMRGLVAAGMAVLSLINTAEAYWQQYNAELDPRWVSDAQQVSSLLEGADYLILTADKEYFSALPNNLDVQGRDVRYAVELDDIMENTPLGGAYVPFQPRSYYLTNAIHETPAVDWVVLDIWRTRRMIFADPEAILRTPEQTYLLIPVEDGRPWVHSALSGIPGNKVGEDCKLSIFDEAVCAQETVRIGLRVMGTAGLTLMVSSGDFVHAEVLTGSMQWIELEVPGATDGEPLRVKLSTYGEVSIDSYSVEGQRPVFM